jgi:peroxiredoxin
MKTRVLLLLLVLPVALFAQKKDPNKQRMTLKGECPALYNGQTFYLESKNRIDSAVVKDGRFVFSLKNVMPNEYIITRNGKDGNREAILLYLDYCDTYIKMDEGTSTYGNTVFAKCTVTGNPTDSVVRDINEVIFTSADEKIFSSPQFIQKLTDVAGRHDMASVYVMGKYCILYFQNNLGSKVKESMDHMSPRLLNSLPGRNLQDSYAYLSTLAVGAAAPDFTLNTPDGKSITLSEYLKGKKLVLIDFWASWCAPCRAEYKNVKAIYADYNAKGFDVLSVSLDNDAAKWKEAIRKDGLTWTHVSDLKGWKTPLCKLYNFNGIPALYLVDGSGRIVATNLRGEALRNKVAELCK